MWPIHTVVFDLDDTLFAEEQFVISGFRAVDAWLMSEHGIFGFLTRATALYSNGLRGRIFNVAILELGRIPSSALIKAMLGIYRDHKPTLTLLPDAEHCLNWARTRWRLALLTDGYQSVQQRKLAALDVAAHFACVVFTDSLGRAFWKPSPAGFYRIMDQLHGAPQGFVYVADNPHKDFIGPRMLGWRTIRIRRAKGEYVTYDPSPAEAAEQQVRSLDELRELIGPAELSEKGLHDRLPHRAWHDPNHE
jgi:putative hydrolase of the HAD superfamily